MIITKTPFRISFFGGGTDYPDWYRQNGGQVLSTTFDKYCYLSCRFLPPFFEHKNKIKWSKIEEVNHFDEIIHPSIRESLKFLNIDKGVEVHFDADLPARSGIASSSACTVGMLHSLYRMIGGKPSKKELAQTAIHLEQNILKENVGSQDQVATAYGGFNKIIFGNGHQEFEVKPLEISKERLKELEKHFMLFFTGLSRTASEVVEAQLKNMPNKTKELQNMHAMVDQAIEILTGKEDIREFGKLLHKNWQIKRTLSDKITNDGIDSIYEAAINAGALGGKILGAGGGGFLLIFAEPDKQDKVKKALSNLLYIPFGFENKGTHIIHESKEMV